MKLASKDLEHFAPSVNHVDHQILHFKAVKVQDNGPWSPSRSRFMLLFWSHNWNPSGGKTCVLVMRTSKRSWWRRWVRAFNSNVGGDCVKCMILIMVQHPWLKSTVPTKWHDFHHLLPCLYCEYIVCAISDRKDGSLSKCLDGISQRLIQVVQRKLLTLDAACTWTLFQSSQHGDSWIINETFDRREPIILEEENGSYYTGQKQVRWNNTTNSMHLLHSTWSLN